ncbi:MAG: hypothetical protein HOV83_01590 [Catenulispora sp.]|nr:hypothetical protein [Catenulispora sp.]
MPATLLAGVLLMTGAIAAHNGTMIVVTFVLVAVTLMSVSRSGENRRDQR